MAFEYPQPLKITRVAKVDLSAKQFYAVKLAALAAAYSDGLEDQVDIVADDTDIPIGILQNKPKAGMEAEICVIGLTKFSGAGDLSGSFPATPMILQVADNGELEALENETGVYAIGQMLVAPTAAHAIGTAVVNFANPVAHA